MSNEIVKLSSATDPIYELWQEADHQYLEGQDTPTKRSLAAKRFGQWLLWCEPLWVAILAPLVLLPGQWVPQLIHPVIVTALLLFWPVRLMIERRFAERTPLNSMVTLMVVLIPLGIWVSPVKQLSWEGAGYLLFGIAIFTALVNWPITRTYPWLVGIAICGLGVGLAAIGPQILNAAPRKFFDNAALEETVRTNVTGGLETVNPNILAGGLVFSLPLLFALSLHSHLRSKRSVELSEQAFGIALAIFCGLLTLGVAFVIVLTQSRGAYIAGALACWLVVLLRWPRIWPLMILLLAGVGAVSYWFGLEQFLDQSAYDSSINSFQARIEIWKRSLMILSDFPFTGIGIGTFGIVVPQLYSYSFYDSPPNIPHAHNMLLQIGGDLGLLGAAAFIGLAVATYCALVKTYQTQSALKPELNRALAIGGIGALTGMLVHGFFDSVLWGTKLSFLPWLLIALAVLLPKTVSRKRRRRQHPV